MIKAEFSYRPIVIQKTIKWINQFNSFFFLIFVVKDVLFALEYYVQSEMSLDIGFVVSRSTQMVILYRG